MFYLTEVDDYVRVEPKLFGIPTKEAVDRQLEEIYEDYYDKELGKVVSVVEVMEVGDGVLIPGDGAAYYNSSFKLLTWKPEINELVFGVISEITSFGADYDVYFHRREDAQALRGEFKRLRQFYFSQVDKQACRV